MELRIAKTKSNSERDKANEGEKNPYASIDEDDEQKKRDNAAGQVTRSHDFVSRQGRPTTGSGEGGN
jgi:hypothetical protein